MKLEGSPALDALCGEYLLGTLRGAARRRFERALREEPRVALRLAHYQRTFVPSYSTMIEVQPSARVWQRLDRELALAQYRTPWHRRLAFWRGLAAAATAVLAIAIGFEMLRPVPPEATVQIAVLEGKTQADRVLAKATVDRRVLELKPDRDVIAGTNQSYELWLLPAEGGPPISLAVLGRFETRFTVPPAYVDRLRSGAQLAVSVEPAGGSPTGAPTGEVIRIGPVTS